VKHGEEKKDGKASRCETPHSIALEEIKNGFVKTLKGAASSMSPK
jgi:hypothetical protein